MNTPPYKQLLLLAARLERLSADSYWAHRASGLRGSILRALEEFERGNEPEPARTETLIRQGYFLLERAARERVASAAGR